LVDLDTMYIDTRSFLAGAVASWALAVLAVGVDARMGDALAGIIGAGGIVVFIEVVNQFYKRVRGQHGMGMGDYMLIVATIGVPVAVTGVWQLTQGILIVSLLAGILGWIALRLTQKGFNRNTPYAFGPYLATGWMVALLLWSVSR
jgi:prepilin signal peptidase PulO-like enzyme (type II secretory pathway)